MHAGATAAGRADAGPGATNGNIPTLAFANTRSTPGSLRLGGRGGRPAELPESSTTATRHSKLPAFGELPLAVASCGGEQGSAAGCKTTATSLAFRTGLDGLHAVEAEQHAKEAARGGVEAPAVQFGHRPPVTAAGLAHAHARCADDLASFGSLARGAAAAKMGPSRMPMPSFSVAAAGPVPESAAGQLKAESRMACKGTGVGP